MRTFDVANYGRLNLQVTILGTTYQDADFTLSGVTSFSKGDASSTSGSLNIRCTYANFNTFALAETVLIDLITDSGAYPYQTLYIKHPIDYDGEFATLTIDTVPYKNQYGYTDTRGNELPYSFGQPWVKAVDVSHRVVGVALEDYHLISLVDINDLMMAYLEFVEAMYYIRITGEEDTGTGGQFSAVTRFSSIIQALAARAPEHTTTLHDFYTLLFYVGTQPIAGSTVFRGVLPDDHPVSVVMDNYGMDRVRAAPTNEGVMPLITINEVVAASSLEGHLIPLNTDGTWYNTWVGANKDGRSIHTQLNQWIKDLTRFPSAIAMDIGLYVGYIEVKINGVILKGHYENFSLTIESYGYFNVYMYMQPSGEDPYKIEVIDLSLWDMIDRFVRVRYNISGPRGALTLEYATRVVDQNGSRLTLEHLPFRSLTSSNPPSLYLDDQEELLVSDQEIFGFLRDGHIIGIADTEAALNVGNSQLDPDVLTLPYGRIWADGLGGTIEYTDANGDQQSYDTPTGLVYSNSILYNLDVFQTASGGEISYSEDFDSGNDSLVYYKGGEPYALDLSIGDDIELNDEFQTVLIVDVRPNMPILGVKSKVGGNYVDLPAKLYTIDPAFKYEVITCTALLLSPRFKVSDFSEDIVVQVGGFDTHPMDMVYHLSEFIGKTAVGLSDFAAYTPNFTRYGYTAALDTINEIVTQINGGYRDVDNIIYVRNLLTPEAPVATLSGNNVDKFVYETTDILDTLGVTTYTWDSLKEDGNSVVVKLEVRPPALTDTDTKDSLIYDDRLQTERYAKFDIHRNGRRWLLATVEGFMDSINLEPMDIVTVVMDGVSTLAEVQAVDYDHGSGGTTVQLIMNKCLSHSYADLWRVDEDIVVTTPPRWFGYNPVNNIQFLEYSR